jgi:hypothetical protein
MRRDTSNALRRLARPIAVLQPMRFVAPKVFRQSIRKLLREVAKWSKQLRIRNACCLSLSGGAHETQGIRLHADLVLEVVGKLLDGGPVAPFADHERAIELRQLGQR